MRVDGQEAELSGRALEALESDYRHCKIRSKTVTIKQDGVLYLWCAEGEHCSESVGMLQ